MPNVYLSVMATLFTRYTAQGIVVEVDLFILTPRCHGSLKAQLT